MNSPESECPCNEWSVCRRSAIVFFTNTYLLLLDTPSCSHTWKTPGIGPPPRSLRRSNEGKRCVTPPFLNIVRYQYRTCVPSLLLTETLSRMFLQGETPDPSDNCSGTDITSEICSGAHISRGNIYHCNTASFDTPSASLLNFRLHECSSTPGFEDAP